MCRKGNRAMQDHGYKSEKWPDPSGPGHLLLIELYPPLITPMRCRVAF